MIEKIRRVGSGAVQWLWCYLLLMAAWAVPTRTLALALGIEHTTGLVICAVVGVLLAVAVYLSRHRVQQWLQAISEHGVPGGWHFALLIGLACRIAWMLMFPATPSSDGAMYIGLAQKLLATGEYGSEGARAYWPPGYVLLLSSMAATGFSLAVLLPLLNLLIYVVLAFLVPWQTRRWFGESAARTAGWLLALWPSLITFGGLPEKELPAMLLVVCIVVLLAESGRVWRLVLAGLCMGFLILLQPSFQFWPAAFLAFLFFNGASLKKATAKTLLVAFVALLVVTPWTLRNFKVFDQFVFISTNGGSNLYRANNPLANGSYSEKGEVSLDGLSELDADRQGKILAKRWLIDHPADAFKLSLHKQRLFLGEDGVGLYATFRGERDRIAPWAYFALKAFNQAFWGFVLVLMAYASLAKTRPIRVSGPAGMAVLSVLYLFALHSIFESNAKYHVPLYGLFTMLAAAALARPNKVGHAG